MGKVIVEGIAFFAILAAARFVPAGGLAWPMGWAVLAVYLGFTLAGLVPIPRPLLEERSRLSSFESASDLALGALFAVLLYPGTLVACGLDRRLGWSPPLAAAVPAIALALFVAGYAFAFQAMRENPFFSTAVRLQTERGHRLVTTGPYAAVRHPGYAGAIVAHLAIPLALGSLAGLAPAALGGALVALRAAREDRFLREYLPGYPEYAGRVRSRLVPGLW
jgi:protein-S-isoprenylcysteine O-methyltransferase Ste14